jgi:hypothetical protein
VAVAMQEPEVPDFDFDAHIAALIARSERNCRGDGGGRGSGRLGGGGQKGRQREDGGRGRRVEGVGAGQPVVGLAAAGLVITVYTAGGSRGGRGTGKGGPGEGM